ncbi:NADPH-dependent FMN reductase family protein [Lysobacter antibioticus]|uniref:NADPH-dependent FMN reductase n=1 Tax=Lysobacter antibioticus TaxID=84531 RepID=UPI00071753EF|nr:NAD(P)H-dependent oxidoreductase [Lysobacter antibioticus]ALN61775.1 NADPH-dependent FMN reductase family protein [Lysobacter antibioticus]
MPPANPAVSPVRLLAFAGSLRAGSYNRRLIPVLVEGARAAGAEVTLIELRDYPLPIYDGDIEAEGMPEHARRLQALLAEHDGLLISTPEYNGSMPALIKNTLDWISRPLADGRSGTALFADKVAGIVSASPGPLGGLRSLLVLRDALAKLGLIVVPQQVAVGQAADKLIDFGQLNDERQRDAVHRVGAAVVRHLKVYQGAPA